MNFRIMPRGTAQKASRQGKLKNSVVISIADVGASNATIDTAKEVLFLHFDDNSYLGPNPIKAEDAKAIVDFVNRWKTGTEEIVVSCHDGKCRSAAVAAAIKFALTGDDWDIFRNPKFCLNEWVYQVMLKAFGLWDEKLATEKHEISLMLRDASDDLMWAGAEYIQMITKWLRDNAHLLDEKLFMVIETHTIEKNVHNYFIVYKKKVYEVVVIWDSSNGYQWFYLNANAPTNKTKFEEAVKNHPNFTTCE